MTKNSNISALFINPIDLHIGKKLKEERLLSGMTQDQIGELVGITFQQIQKYEKGINRISASKLYEISQIFEKPISSFFNDYVSDNQYHNIEFKTQKDQKRKNYIKNREMVRLFKSFNKIDGFEVRDSVVKLLDSIADNKKKRHVVDSLED